jgi:hypothetical protein
MWPTRRWLIAVGAAAVSALLIGAPTVMFSNPWFTRMTPTTWWDRPVWIVTSALAGLVAATYVRRPLEAGPGGASSTAASGGLLAAFAVGCPVCNKLVVAVVGVTGALTLWAPLQPLLALLSVALLVVALRRRLEGERSCTIAPSGTPVGPRRS